MFHKFPKITNVGSDDPFGGRYITSPSEWIATEKIDGCNVSIIIDKDRSINFAGRTHLIDDTYNIYNLKENIDKYSNLVNSLVDIANKHNFESLNVFGEYYGLGIQDRIYYGNDKNIRIYAALVNETNWLSITEFLKIFGNIDSSWLIPVLGKFPSWEEAVYFAEDYGIKNNITSTLSEKDAGEGVVLYPTVKTTPTDFVAYKYKTDKFKENTQKSEDIIKALNNQNRVNYVKTQQIKEILKDHININRVYSLISKVGKPKEKKDIGKFLSLLVQDALDDCIAEYPDLFNNLSSKEESIIKNLSGYPYQIYMQYLNNCV